MSSSTEPENPDDIVTFLSATGEEISNDPRWHARKVLNQTGVNVDDLQSQIAQLTAERDAALDAAHTAGSRASDSGEAPETDDDETSNDDDPEADEYDKLKGAELKKLAKTRGVDIAGMTKVSEVRDALRTADQEAAE